MRVLVFSFLVCILLLLGSFSHFEGDESYRRPATRHKEVTNSPVRDRAPQAGKHVWHDPEGDVLNMTSNLLLNGTSCDISSMEVRETAGGLNITLTGHRPVADKYVYLIRLDRNNDRSFDYSVQKAYIKDLPAGQTHFYDILYTARTDSLNGEIEQELVHDYKPSLRMYFEIPESVMGRTRQIAVYGYIVHLSEISDHPDMLEFDVVPNDNAPVVELSRKFDPHPSLSFDIASLEDLNDTGVSDDIIMSVAGAPPSQASIFAGVRPEPEEYDIFNGGLSETTVIKKGEAVGDDVALYDMPKKEVVMGMYYNGDLVEMKDLSPCTVKLAVIDPRDGARIIGPKIVLEDEPQQMGSSSLSEENGITESSMWPGYYEVNVGAPGFAQKTFGFDVFLEKERHIVIEMTPETDLTVSLFGYLWTDSLRDDPRVLGSQVFVSFGEEEKRVEKVYNTSGSNMYQFRVSSGFVSLWAENAGYYDKFPTTVDVSYAGTVRHDITMSQMPKESYNLMGRINDSRGTPVGPTFIYLIDLQYSILESGLIKGEMFYSNFTGQYSIDSYPGRFKLVTFAQFGNDRFLDNRINVDLNKGEVVQDIVMEYKPEGHNQSVNGTVIDGDGNPVPGAIVALFDRDRNILYNSEEYFDNYMNITNMTGYFEINDIYQGNFSLVTYYNPNEVRSNGYLENLEAAEVANYDGSGTSNMLNRGGGPRGHPRLLEEKASLHWDMPVSVAPAGLRTLARSSDRTRSFPGRNDGTEADGVSGGNDGTGTDDGGENDDGAAGGWRGELKDIRDSLKDDLFLGSSLINFTADGNSSLGLDLSLAELGNSTTEYRFDLSDWNNGTLNVTREWTHADFSDTQLVKLMIDSWIGNGNFLVEGWELNILMDQRRADFENEIAVPTDTDKFIHINGISFDLFDSMEYHISALGPVRNDQAISEGLRVDAASKNEIPLRSNYDVHIMMDSNFLFNENQLLLEIPPGFTFKQKMSKDRGELLTNDTLLKATIPYRETFDVTLGVEDGELPKAFISGPEEWNEDEEVIFNAKKSTDNVEISEYIWVIESVGLIVQGPSRDEVNVTFHRPGIHAVSLTVIDAVGNQDEQTFEIEILDVTYPVAEIDVPEGWDEDSEFEYDAAGSHDNVGIVEWNFSLSDGRYWNEPAASITINEPGEYDYALVVKDGAGWTTEISGTIYVLDVTPPVPEIAANENVKAGDLMTFNAQGSFDNVDLAQDLNYTWDLGDGNTTQGIYVEHVYSKPGNYTVVLTVRDRSGNGNETRFTVNVEEREEIAAGTNDIDPCGLLIVLAIAVALGVLFSYTHRRLKLGGYSVELILLIYKDGTLLSQVKPERRKWLRKEVETSLDEEMDTDILSGMLTAVKNFVKDSFKGEEGELSKLEYGDHMIIMDKGNFVTVAVVIKGHDWEGLHKQISKVVSKIEQDYGEALEGWKGDLDDFDGVEEYLRKIK